MNLPLSTLVRAWAEPLGERALKSAVVQLGVLADRMAHDAQTRAALFAPTYETDAKEALLRKAGFDTAVVKLVGYLDTHQLWSKIDQVARVAERFYQENHGVLPAHVRAAVALTAKERATLTKQLSARLKREIDLRETVDPSILGGLVVDVQGQRHDHSVRGKLTRFTQNVTSLV